MTGEITPITHRTGMPPWLVGVMAIAALVLATAALTATLTGRGPTVFAGGDGPGMMGYGYGGYGMMGGAYGPGMMGYAYGPGAANGYGAGLANGPQPGEAGFIAGTTAAPRVVRVFAGPGATFTPATIAVARGETVTFVVTTMGPTVHEFMVGPADAVAADKDGTPEISGIGMMVTKTLTYTFSGSGPYAYACHAPGDYEAGMRGTITIVG